MKIILGIDPGFGRMGFGCVCVEKHGVRALDFGVMTTTNTGIFEDRLLHLAHDLNELISTLKPDLIVVEKLFFGKSVTTAMKVSEVRGVVRLLAAQARVPVLEFGPAQVKKAITGSGTATKQGMQKMVAQLLGLPRIPRPDDAADALALALTASTMHKFY